MTNSINLFKHSATIAGKEQSTVDLSNSKIDIGYFLMN